MTGPARVMVPVDLSELSLPAIEHARELRTRWASTIHVFYIWPEAQRPEAPPPRWGVLDHLSQLERRGIVAIPGYLTPKRGGMELAQLGAAARYDLIIVGARDESVSQRFEMHGPQVLSAGASRYCPLLTVPFEPFA